MPFPLSDFEKAHGYQYCTVCTNLCLSHICGSCWEEAGQRKAIKLNGGNTPQVVTRWNPCGSAFDISPEKICEMNDPISSRHNQ